MRLGDISLDNKHYTDIMTMANKSNEERKAEMVEQVSTTTSSLHITNENADTAADKRDGWKSRLDKSMISLEQQTCEFNKKIQPQITNINKLITVELNEIETKDNKLGEQFKIKLDEYKKTKEQLEELEEEHSELTENTKLLTDDLECISDELDQMKKKMESKSSSVTDATPLVDIRAAIQRLKRENKEMDIRIGVLDYELIQARMAEAKGLQEYSTSRGVSDDDEESDDEEEGDDVQ